MHFRTAGTISRFDTDLAGCMQQLGCLAVKRSRSDSYMQLLGIGGCPDLLSAVQLDGVGHSRLCRREELEVVGGREVMQSTKPGRCRWQKQKGGDMKSVGVDGIGTEENISERPKPAQCISKALTCVRVFRRIEHQGLGGGRG